LSMGWSRTRTPGWPVEVRLHGEESKCPAPSTRRAAHFCRARSTQMSSLSLRA
jgi:hypothetical protein